MKTLTVNIVRTDDGKIELECEAEALPIKVIEKLLNNVAEKIEEETAYRILNFFDKATDGLIGDISKNVIEAAERGEQLSATDEFIKAFKSEGGKIH